MALQKIPLMIMGMLLFLTIVCSLKNPDRSAATGANGRPVCPPNPLKKLSREYFPEGILFGTATASYQVEGAVKEGCRGPSLWDNYCAKNEDKCNGADGSKAVDFFHRYKEDIKLMNDLNTNAFRLSIAWPRIFPHGRMENGGESKAGVQFYHDVIDELLENGIIPSVTLFHWDTPQYLEDEYGGFLSDKIVKDFREYAEFVFKQYSAKVKNWITFNEPWVFVHAGYDVGKKAPGRCSDYIHDIAKDGLCRSNPEPKHRCLGGQSGVEIYQVSHNLLNAHAEAVEAFRACKECKGGKIGIAHSPAWFEPHDSENEKDKESTKRALDFMLGWHLDTTTFGDYPETMKKILGNRLPRFTDEQKAKLKGSTDFVGMNYYTSIFGKSIEEPDQFKPSWKQDSGITWENMTPGKLRMGSKHDETAVESMTTYSGGLRKLLKHIKENYGNPEIMIMENGYGEKLGKKDSVENGINDTNRVSYLIQHLLSLYESICEDNVNVTGYFVWSLLDNFEWQDGYSTRFGLYYVDFEEGKNLKRHLKKSGMFYQKFLTPPSKIKKDEL